MSSLNVYVGFDANETAAYHVLCHSILQRAQAPVSFTPLIRGHFPYFTRKRGPLESTDFSISRFLVPYLSGYQGYSLYMDADMLCQVPINELWQALSPNDLKHKAVWVCPHDYIPSSDRKMQDQVQTPYPRKNWSSFMFFDNSECRVLTPDYVNTATGLQLHRFEWLQDEQIGFLPLEWNWLLGEYASNPEAKVLHYTLGGPWLPKYRDCDQSREWYAEYRSMTGMDYYPTQVWQQPPLGSPPDGIGRALADGA